MAGALQQVRPTRQWPRGPFNDLHAAAMRGSVKRTLEVLSRGAVDINLGEGVRASTRMEGALWPQGS